MNVTVAPYDGPSATSYTLDSSQGLPVAVQTGARATLEVLQVHLGLQGEPGPVGPAGGAMTGGTGIVVIGTEIRLSIGTLPQVG
jgi:hypothetical protein